MSSVTLYHQEILALADIMSDGLQTIGSQLVNRDPKVENAVFYIYYIEINT